MMNLKNGLLALIFLFSATTFAEPVKVQDLVSCADSLGKFTLDGMINDVEEGYTTLPIFNRKKEMVGYLLIRPTETESKKLGYIGGIRLCAKFISDFHYPSDEAQFAKGWVSEAPKSLEITQDEGTLRLVVQNYTSPSRAVNSNSQLVRVQYEATDLSVGEDEPVVGRGEFFIFFPKSWL